MTVRRAHARRGTRGVRTHTVHIPQGHRVVAFDDGGKAVDRYTIVVDDDSVYAMNEYPQNPSGFNQFAGTLSTLDYLRSIYPRGDAKEGFKRVSFKSLPEPVRQAIRDRIVTED